MSEKVGGNTNGKMSLGIEFGSTRIKSVLIDESYNTVASGGFTWENKLENGYWTYNLEDVWSGVQESIRNLKTNIPSECRATLSSIGTVGISAMMHGYLAFDGSNNLLTPFRTWRNTTTEQAAEILTEKLSFNIPQRWSIAHLYQAILNEEKHTDEISFITTLAGYVHWKLTGEKVLGIGDASGMFPVSSETNDYNENMLNKFNDLVKDHKYSWNLTDILPKVLSAGESAGTLTKEGALLLDPSGELRCDIPLCPPEGDAGTGMVATNAVTPLTGNVSAGTSIFAMIVLERELAQVHTEIDMVATPHGKSVAMVHCNNCSSDLDAWVNLINETTTALGFTVSKPVLYDTLYGKALEGDVDCGEIMCYNYFSGEPITGLSEGRPLLVRSPDSRFGIANLMKSIIFSAIATLKIGMDILSQDEQVHAKNLMGHGGLFKTPVVGQKLMAGALNIPVTVMESAGEGGAWGIAVLASYLNDSSISLEKYLADKVFAKIESSTIVPDKADTDSFDLFIERYKKGLAVEAKAVEVL